MAPAIPLARWSYPFRQVTPIRSLYRVLACGGHQRWRCEYWPWLGVGSHRQPARAASLYEPYAASSIDSTLIYIGWGGGRGWQRAERAGWGGMGRGWVGCGLGGVGRGVGGVDGRRKGTGRANPALHALDTWHVARTHTRAMCMCMCMCMRTLVLWMAQSIGLPCER